MRPIPNRRAALLLGLAVAFAFAASGLARADGRGDHDGDHERALRALQEGDARPLADILALVRDQLGGEIVGVEFERENGRYVYEFTIIAADGRLREVYVDAKTGDVLKSEDD